MHPKSAKVIKVEQIYLVVVVEVGRDTRAGTIQPVAQEAFQVRQIDDAANPPAPEAAGHRLRIRLADGAAKHVITARARPPAAVNCTPTQIVIPTALG